MQAISLIIHISVILASTIALKAGVWVLLVHIILCTCNLGLASIFTATLGPQALASDVALSLTGLQDCHNTIHILELHVTILQSVEHLNKPVYQAFCSSRPDVIVLRVSASQPLHEFSLSYQCGAGLIHLGQPISQGQCTLRAVLLDMPPCRSPLEERARGDMGPSSALWHTVAGHVAYSTP